MKDKQKSGAMQILLLYCVLHPLLIFSQIQPSGDAGASASGNGTVVSVSSAQAPDVGVTLSTNSGLWIERDGATFNAVYCQDAFESIVHVANFGDQPTSNIRVMLTLPKEVRVLDQTPPPVYGNENSLLWSLTLPAESDTSIIVSLSNRLEAEASAVFVAEVHAPDDANPGNDSDSLTIWSIDTPANVSDSCDLSIQYRLLTVPADSFEALNGDTLAVLQQGRVYPISLSLSNLTASAAQNIRVKCNALDDGVISGADPSPYTFTADSIVWFIREIAPFVSVKLQADVSAPPELPDGRHILNFQLQVAADNELSTATGDNLALLQFVAYGQPPQPFEPRIEMQSLTASVSDSIWLRVLFPVPVISWDVLVHLPDGEIIDDLFDSFIARTTPRPDVWYDIDEPFVLPALQGGGAEEIVFEIRATGANGASGSASFSVSIQGSFALMPPNVVHPESDGIPIDFVVPGGRVEMNLYDVAGRFITTLVDASYEPGSHTLFWNGMTEQGQLVGSGVYLITMRTETENTWKKMIIVR